MPTFAPVYRPSTDQQSFLTRKRKRDADASDDENEGLASPTKQSPPPESDILDEPRVPHPVNKKDPYYVAGWPREKPLPGGNFPHAAVKEPSNRLSVEEEPAQLKPPLYVPKANPEGHSGSLKRRHLDNLTAILHKCMLHGDWVRASRVWGLILRTEIAGHGPDIRQHGRWMVGAELLMRRSQALGGREARPSTRSGDGEVTSARDDAVQLPVISDEGFRQARDYYERLILQYPHRERAKHSDVTAKVIYPALFNIWVYEVQQRARRAKTKLSSSHDMSELDDTRSVQSDTSDQLRSRYQIQHGELEEVGTISQRLDELLLNPPYDTSPELLELRSMVALWTSNLHKQLAGIHAASLSGTSSEDDDNQGGREESRESKSQHQKQSGIEKENAKKIFEKMLSAGMELSNENLTFLRESHEAVKTEIDEDD